MKVFVLGGDGFCGWPTSLHLSDLGHDVTIVDNLSRRKIDIDLEVESLTPITPIGERIKAWKELTGNEIGFVHLDLAQEYDRLEVLFREQRPDAVVHFGEQRAAPDLRGIIEQSFTRAGGEPRARFLQQEIGGRDVPVVRICPRHREMNLPAHDQAQPIGERRHTGRDVDSRA